MEQLYNQLLEQLADIERQQETPNLSHSDQQLLDQAWEDINNRLDELDDILDTETVEWRDAMEYLEDDDDDTVETLSVRRDEDDEEEEMYQAWLASNGCEYCSGCHYCTGGGYDPAGEI